MSGYVDPQVSELCGTHVPSTVVIVSTFSLNNSMRGFLLFLTGRASALAHQQPGPARMPRKKESDPRARTTTTAAHRGEYEDCQSATPCFVTRSFTRSCKYF